MTMMCTPGSARPSSCIAYTTSSAAWRQLFPFGAPHLMEVVSRASSDYERLQARSRVPTGHDGQASALLVQYVQI